MKKKSMPRRILGYFLKGLLIVVPIFITCYVIYWLFTKIDHILQTSVPGVGFVLTIILITVVGLLASTIFARFLLRWVDRLFNRIPLVKILYNALKDLSGALVGDKKLFDKPVLVALVPESNAKVLGFITREDLEFLGVKDHVSVYLPQSYNFAGNLIIVPKSQVTPIARDSAEVMAFIISAGVGGKGNK